MSNHRHREATVYSDADPAGDLILIASAVGAIAIGFFIALSGVLS